MLRFDWVQDLAKMTRMEVGVHEAKTNLSKLLRRVAAGEEVVILRSGKPIARIVPIEPPKKRVWVTTGDPSRCPRTSTIRYPTTSWRSSITRPTI